MKKLKLKNFYELTHERSFFFLFRSPENVCRVFIQTESSIGDKKIHEGYDSFGKMSCMNKL